MTHACDAHRSILRWRSSLSGAGTPYTPDAGIVQSDDGQIDLVLAVLTDGSAPSDNQ